jgi:SAM-dependent methyltransferase
LHIHPHGSFDCVDLSEVGAALGRHPWEVERFRAYRRILSDHRALGAHRVLDVGAGDGWFSLNLVADLGTTAQVVCWDINYDEVELERDTGDARLVRTAAPPAPGFDLVLVLDVLEHIADPVGFISEQLQPLVAPGAGVLVAVPAHPWLFGDHDRALGHYRRYTVKRLLDDLTPWIHVVDHGPLFVSLVAPRAVAIVAERLRARLSPDVTRSPVANHGVGERDHGIGWTRATRAALAIDSMTARVSKPVSRHFTGLSHWVYGTTR